MEGHKKDALAQVASIHTWNVENAIGYLYNPTKDGKSIANGMYCDYSTDINPEAWTYFYSYEDKRFYNIEHPGTLKVLQNKLRGVHSKKDSKVESEAAQETMATEGCPLFQSVKQDFALSLLQNDDYCAFELYDGMQTKLEIISSRLSSKGFMYNNLGKPIPMTDLVRDDIVHVDEDIRNSLRDTIFDGVEADGVYRIIDMPQRSDEDLRNKPYKERFNRLSEALPIELEDIEIAEVAFSTRDKAILMEKLMKAGKKGICFKRLSSTYTAGKSEDQYYYSLKAIASMSPDVTREKKSDKVSEES